MQSIVLLRTVKRVHILCKKSKVFTRKNFCAHTQLKIKENIVTTIYFLVSLDDNLDDDIMAIDFFHLNHG